MSRGGRVDSTPGVCLRCDRGIGEGKRRILLTSWGCGKRILESLMSLQVGPLNHEVFQIYIIIILEFTILYECRCFYCEIKDICIIPFLVLRI